MLTPKVRIGITGGIGSGKSYVCSLLRQRGIPVFDCDAAARVEMLENAALREALKRLMGDDVYDGEGQLVKPRVRAFLCSAPEAAARLNALVHPCVRERLSRWVTESEHDVVAVECALLYEAGFYDAVDMAVVVTAPREVRIRRVMERDGLSRSKVEAMMRLQLSEEEKIKKADMVIQNDGKTDLNTQICHLLSRVKVF